MKTITELVNDYIDSMAPRSEVRFYDMMDVIFDSVPRHFVVEHADAVAAYVVVSRKDVTRIGGDAPGVDVRICKQ